MICRFAVLSHILCLIVDDIYRTLVMHGVYFTHIYLKKKRRRERRMAVVEQRLHDRKELWLPYLVCKNNEFFLWRITDTAVRTANWLRLNMTVHQKFRNMAFHCPSVSQTPNKNEASATEFWRISTNDMTRHQRSALYGDGIMEDYFLLIFNTHISFQSYNRRSTTDIRRSPRQQFLK